MGHYTSFTATRDVNSTKPFRERWLELRQKYPSDFTMSPSEVDAWDRLRTARAETKQDWSNAVTYLTALMEKHPDSADFPLRRAAAYVAWAESLIAHELRSTANTTNLLQLALADYDHTLVWSERFPESIKETRELLLWSRIEVLRKLHRHKEAQKDWLEVNAIPPRPAQTDPRLIDLSQWFNWADGSPFEAAMVRKLVTGTEFDVRSSVWLARNAADSSEYPEKVTGIPIKQICHRIHFLHAADTTSAVEGVSVSKFIIHLANGTRDTIEIKIGLDVWGGYGLTKEQTRPTRNSVMAWSGQIHPEGIKPQLLQLFESNWQNPFPDVPVVSIDFESSMNGAQPGLYGITVDP